MSVFGGTTPDLPNTLIMRIIRESTQLKRAPYQGVVDYFNNVREVDFEPEEIINQVQNQPRVHTKHWIRWDPDPYTQPESVHPMYHDVFEKEDGPNRFSDRFGNCIENMVNEYKLESTNEIMGYMEDDY